MSDVLHVQLREKTGTADTRRLRRTGHVPAVLYGHGEGSVHLTIPSSEVAALVRHHGRTVKLSGAVEEDAFVKDVQWDPLGIEVLHLDFFRVSLDEVVEVEVPVVIHGEAPGTGEGGVVTEVVHEITILCPAGKVPTEVDLSVNQMHLGDQLTAADVSLPEGASLVTAADTVLVTVTEAQTPPEAIEGVTPPGEPEMIGKGVPEEEED